ncbi:DUF2997 domain-containing protein [Allorhodopirellula solitaria]|uniref:DUF2997 domain-containing protein n=1 Tax=Allorhodopirellula solitaria TaxID=2527987 RepID=A0A5C5X2X3_9BACT|nr:DUF2997 domain-containing protein [Allorhodopirellula solitaria]TWT56542.1 hypothetical protein CA85_40750 [Allorhodopirellula solitaria]
MKTIEVIVGPDGESRLETNGYGGSDCRQASEFLEQALGSRQSERLKPEFYAQADAREQQQARQR